MRCLGPIFYRIDGIVRIDRLFGFGVFEGHGVGRRWWG